MAKKPKLLGLVAEIGAEMGRQGLTRYALAKATGMTGASVGRILSGERPDPQVSSLIRLAEALGCSIKLAK